MGPVAVPAGAILLAEELVAAEANLPVVGLAGEDTVAAVAVVEQGPAVVGPEDTAAVVPAVAAAPVVVPSAVAVDCTAVAVAYTGPAAAVAVAGHTDRKLFPLLAP